MNYKQETAVVSKAEQGIAEVYIAFPHKEHGTGTCAGCGLCASRPGGRTYSLIVPQGKELKTGDVIILNTAEIPFALSICMVFILPLILMVLFPVMSIMFGKGMDIPVLSSAWFIVCGGAFGFTAAIIINFIVDRWFRKRYPPRIEDKDD